MGARAGRQDEQERYDRQHDPRRTPLVRTRRVVPGARARARARSSKDYRRQRRQGVLRRAGEKGVTCELIFNGAIAMITDPAGVTIEINSGLENR